MSESRSGMARARRCALATITAATLAMTVTACLPRSLKPLKGGLLDCSNTPNVRVQLESVPVLVGSFKGGKPKMPVMSVYGKKAADPSFGFALLNYELHDDFSVAISVGHFNPKRDLAMNPAVACLELDGVDTDPLEFFSNCVSFDAGGATVFGATRGNSNLGSIRLDGAERVDLRFTTSGSRLHYEAREWKVGAYVSYLDVPIDTSTRQWYPAVGANNVPKRAGFSFSDPRVLFNGAPPERVDLRSRIGDQLQSSMLATLEACEMAFEDAAASLRLTETALTGVRAASALAEDLGADRDSFLATRAIARTDRFLLKTYDLFEQEKSPKKIQKALDRATREQSKAMRYATGIRFNF